MKAVFEYKLVRPISIDSFYNIWVIIYFYNRLFDYFINIDLNFLLGHIM